jgi:hypothetical protein
MSRWSAGALMLGGCAEYGYYDNGYGHDGYAYDDHSGHCTGPTVGLGIGYSDWDHGRGIGATTMGTATAGATAATIATGATVADGGGGRRVV